MSTSTETESLADGRSGGAARAVRNADVWVGLGFAAVGLLALWAGRDLPLTGENRPGPGLVPFGVSVLLVGLGLLLAVRQALAAARAAAPVGTPEVGQGGYGRILAVMATLALTVFLFDRAGFIVAVWVLLGVVMFVVERKYTIASVLMVVLTPLICWALFANLLGVRLPPGLVNF